VIYLVQGKAHNFPTARRTAFLDMMKRTSLSNGTNQEGPKRACPTGRKSMKSTAIIFKTLLAFFFVVFGALMSSGMVFEAGQEKQQEEETSLEKMLNTQISTASKYIQ
jgi:hypothetical protein